MTTFFDQHTNQQADVSLPGMQLLIVLQSQPLKFSPPLVLETTYNPPPKKNKNMYIPVIHEIYLNVNPVTPHTNSLTIILLTFIEASLNNTKITSSSSYVGLNITRDANRFSGQWKRIQLRNFQSFVMFNRSHNKNKVTSDNGVLKGTRHKEIKLSLLLFGQHIPFDYSSSKI